MDVVSKGEVELISKSTVESPLKKKHRKEHKHKHKKHIAEKIDKTKKTQEA
jgi:hypothetical protein